MWSGPESESEHPPEQIDRGEQHHAVAEHVGPVNFREEGAHDSGRAPDHIIQRLAHLAQGGHAGLEATFTPAPPGRAGDASALEDIRHRYPGRIGTGLDLKEFGGLLHHPDYVHFCSVGQCTKAASATLRGVQGRRMDDLRDAVREFFRRGLTKTGWSPYKWAKAAGIAPTTITRPLNDENWKTIPKLATLMKLAEAADIELPDILRQGGLVDLTPVARSIPVLGDVRAGSWERIPDDPEIVEWLPMEVPEYAGAELFAVRVVGKSMDLIYPDGTFVICVPAAQAGLQEGDCVVVRRWDGDRAETTLKQIERQADGSFALQPRSSDAAHQEAIIIPRRDETAQNGVEIIGVVVSDYRKNRRGRGPLITL